MDIIRIQKRNKCSSCGTEKIEVLNSYKLGFAGMVAGREDWRISDDSEKYKDLKKV